MESRVVTFTYGPSAETLLLQFPFNNLKFDIDKVMKYEKERQAINTLRLGGMISQKMSDNLIEKLHILVSQHICEQNSARIADEQYD